jgi:glycosyltransferase involved in cell wall biosynthesis
VLPSYYEAFGCVYTEAMQTGVPIIAVENQGIEEVLKEEEKSFSLIPKGDHRRLADLIEFRYNKRLKVDYDFNIDNYVQQFLNYIQPLPSKKAKQ